MKHNPQPFCVHPGLSEYFYIVTKCLSRLGFCSIRHQIWSQGLDSAKFICWIFFAQSGWGWSAGDENQNNSFRLFQKTPDLFSRGLNRNWVPRGAASTQTSKRDVWSTNWIFWDCVRQMLVSILVHFILQWCFLFNCSQHSVWRCVVW